MATHFSAGWLLCCRICLSGSQVRRNVRDARLAPERDWIIMWTPMTDVNSRCESMWSRTTRGPACPYHSWQQMFALGFDRMTCKLFIVFRSWERISTDGTTVSIFHLWVLKIRNKFWCITIKFHKLRVIYYKTSPCCWTCKHVCIVIVKQVSILMQCWCRDVSGAQHEQKVWTGASLSGFQWLKAALDSPHDMLAEGHRSRRNLATCRRTMSLHTKWNRHPLTPPSFCQGGTFFRPFKMQQLFPIELLLLPLLLAFTKAWGYQRVKEKLPWLCRGPDCTIRAVREALYKGRAPGRARWRLALPPW